MKSRKQEERHQRSHNVLGMLGIQLQSAFCVFAGLGLPQMQSWLLHCTGACFICNSLLGEELAQKVREFGYKPLST